MKRTVFGKLLLICLLVCLFATISITAQAEENPVFEAAGVPDAMIGQTAYNGPVTVPEGAAYTAEVSWQVATYYDGDWYYEAFAGVFADGNVYQRIVAFAGDFSGDYYPFVYINGERAEDFGWTEEYLMAENWYAFTQQITDVQVTGVTEPVLGQTATLDGIRIPADAGYTAQAHWWTDDPEWDGRSLPVFKMGYSYSLSVDFVAKPGYTFAGGYSGDSSTQMQVSVNNEACEDYWDFNRLHGYVSFQYDFLTPISAVTINSISQPQAGMSTGDITASIPADAKYTVQTFWGKFDYEQDWFADFEGQFTQGGLYRMIVYVVPAEGYKFAEDTVVTLGGQVVTDSINVFDSYIDIYIDPIAIGAQSIENVALTAQMEYGKKADPANIKVSQNVNYYIKEAGWYEIDPEGNMTTEDYYTGTFKEGYFYAAVAEVDAKEGYYFTENTTCTVNGTWDKNFGATAIGYGEMNVAMVFIPNASAPDYNGLTLVDGVWGYYEDGILQTDFTDLVYYEGEFFYVVNGILSFDYTGLVLHQGNYYYVENSVLNWGYTGLTLYNGNWYYVQEGVLLWGYYGLVMYEGVWFYVENSTLTFAYTGLVEYMGSWFYVENSSINWGYIGLAMYGDNFFYVENGMINWGYSGLVPYMGNFYYVTGGVLDWGFTDLTLYNGNWYLVQGGQLIWGYDGLILYNGVWFYLENSTITWTYTGLVEYYGNLYYVENSCLNWGYNGTAEYNGVEYQVIGGVAVQ